MMLSADALKATKAKWINKPMDANLEIIMLSKISLEAGKGKYGKMRKVNGISTVFAQLSVDRQHTDTT